MPSSKRPRPGSKLFLLQVIQPGLVGLMDGSVSTLAPLFAAAFATHDTWQTFLVGLAASLGAGISMGLAEALSDDGKLTGRGRPLIRGLASGVMTAVGGLGHALPYLIPDFWTATMHRHHRRLLRIVGDLLDPVQIHGHALFARRVPGGGRRFSGLPDRHIHRKRMKRSSSFRRNKHHSMIFQ